MPTLAMMPPANLTDSQARLSLNSDMEEEENDSSSFLLPGFLSIQLSDDTRQPNLDFPANLPTVLFLVFSLLFELVANLWVLLWVKLKDRVVVDRMITLDCMANLLCIPVIMLAFPVRVYNDKLLCVGITFFRWFVISIKR